MEKIICRLEEETKGWPEVLFYCLSCAFVILLINVVMAVVFEAVGIKIPQNSGGSAPIPILKIWFPALLFYMAGIEELIFRVTPMILAVGLFPKSAKIFVFVAVSSVIFGYLHGGWPNIFIQGFSGCILSWVYLKCGGWNDDHMRGCLASTIAHFSINGFIALVILLHGGRYF